MDRLHKEQEREQKRTEAAFRDEREKQDRFRKAQEEYGKCIEDEAKGMHVYCRPPVNPDDQLDESEVEMFTDSESGELESLQPWASEGQHHHHDYGSEFSDSEETFVFSLPSFHSYSNSSDELSWGSEDIFEE